MSSLAYWFFIFCSFPPCSLIHTFWPLNIEEVAQNILLYSLYWDTKSRSLIWMKIWILFHCAIPSHLRLHSRPESSRLFLLSCSQVYFTLSHFEINTGKQNKIGQIIFSFWKLDGRIDYNEMYLWTTLDLRDC